MILHLYLSGRQWAATLDSLDTGMAGETHPDAEEWPGLYTTGGRWLCAAEAACRDAEARGYTVRGIICYGVPPECVKMIRSGRVEWPADLARWRDALLRRKLRMEARPIPRRERVRVARAVADAPACDAVLTGVAGIGVTALTAMAAGGAA